MNILYVVNGFPHIGETYTFNELASLIDLGHNVHIIALSKPKMIMHEIIKKYDLLGKTKYLEFDSGEGRKKYTRLEIFEKGAKELFENKTVAMEQKLESLKLCYEKEQGREVAFRRFLDYLDIIKFIKDKKIEHIHCNFAWDNVEIVYNLTRFIKIPYTFTTHARDIFVNPRKDIGKWANGAKKVITISEFNKRYMVNNFGINANKIYVIPSSLNLSRLDKIKKEKTTKNKIFTILSVCRLFEKKGLVYLIEACNKLKEKCIDFKCEIYGDGEEENKLKSLIEKYKLTTCLKLSSSLEHDDILNKMKNADLFVLPCVIAKIGDKDMLPNVLKEAMYLGTPVISTDIPCNNELIEHGSNGLIVKQKDVNGLVKAIIRLKNNRRLYDQISRNSPKIIKDKFDIKENIKKLVRLLEDGK